MLLKTSDRVDSQREIHRQNLALSSGDCILNLAKLYAVFTFFLLSLEIRLEVEIFVVFDRLHEGRWLGLFCLFLIRSKLFAYFLSFMQLSKFIFIILLFFFIINILLWIILFYFFYDFLAILLFFLIIITILIFMASTSILSPTNFFFTFTSIIITILSLLSIQFSPSFILLL